MTRRKKMLEDLDRDIQEHIERETQDNIERGMSPEEAHYAALRKFGNVRRVKEETREVWSFVWLENLRQDIRYGLRMLRRSPGFTAVAVLTLALGIGANTAIFSLVNAILLHALPVRDTQSLVVLRWSARKAPEAHSSVDYGDCQTDFSPKGESSSCSFSEPFFKDVAAQNGPFSGVAAFAAGGQLDLSGNGTASVLSSQAVSGEFFSVLGVRPAAGRLVSPSDDSVSAPPVVVLNYGYWKTQFGGSPSAIGRTIRLNNVPFTIIGVADQRFDSLSPGRIYDVWVPLSALPQLIPYPSAKPRATDVYNWWLVIIARLKPGVTPLQAQADVSTLFRNKMLHGAAPLSKPQDDPKVLALPAQEGLTGATTDLSTELYVLMMAVGIVLLVACANVAGLLLSRASARQKEMTVRLALGAGRARILRQLLTESLMLSVAGGALGILFAIWGTRGIVSLITANADSPFGFYPGIDGRVLAFTLAACVFTGIIFGLAPAFRSARIDLTPALKEGAGASVAAGRAGGRWFTLGNGLVVAQVALAVVVLVGAGLLVRTLQNLRNVNPGFDTRDLLTFGLDPALIGYKTPQIDAFYKELQERLAAIPGVQSVSYSHSALLSGALWTTWTTGFHMDYLTIGADFFSTMHMQLLSGRTFNSADFAQAEVAQENQDARQAAMEAKEAGAANPGAPAKAVSSAANEAPVPAIVNKTFVHKYSLKKNVLGIHFGERQANAATGEIASPGWEIVGVVSDAKYQDLRSAIEPTMYVPSSGDSASFELRTAANPTAMISTVRGVVNQMDGNLPVFDAHTEMQLVDQLLSQETMIARLSSFFGALALVLACIGLYGLLSYEISRRTHEIGIRMALGAQRRDLLRLVAGQGTLLVLIGAAIGIAAAIGVTRFMSAMLYGVRAADPLTFAAVATLLMLVALAACYIPTRRAMRVDPMVALRYE